MLPCFVNNFTIEFMETMENFHSGKNIFQFQIHDHQNFPIKQVQHCIKDEHRGLTTNNPNLELSTLNSQSNGIGPEIINLKLLDKAINESMYVISNSSVTLNECLYKCIKSPNCYLVCFDLNSSKCESNLKIDNLKFIPEDKLMLYNIPCFKKDKFRKIEQCND